MKYLKILIPILIIALCISPAYSADWNTFQGDIAHHGFEKECADFVTNLWIFNLESPIFGSPALDGDKIFLASTDGLLKCIDMENGEEIWSIELNNGTFASPVIGGDYLYIGSGDTFYAINKETHKIEWSKQLTGIESTAFVYNKTVFVGTNSGHLYGFDNETGKVTVDIELGGKLKSSPLVVNGTIYIGSTDAKIYAVDTNGNSKWNYTTGDEILSSPAYGDGRIAIGSSDGNLYVFNETNGDLLFKVNLNNKVIGSPTIDVHDNSIYIGSDEGNMTCVDLGDGTIKWSHAVGDAVRSTPALSENNLAFASNNGYGYVLNKYTGEEIFTYNPGTILFSDEITLSPVIYGNSLFFAGHDGYLYSLNLEKHEVPASIWLYIVLAIIIVAIVVITAVAWKFKGKKN